MPADLDSSSVDLDAGKHFPVTNLEDLLGETERTHMLRALGESNGVVKGAA